VRNGTDVGGEEVEIGHGIVTDPNTDPKGFGNL
jgi:hypothetical protein